MTVAERAAAYSARWPERPPLQVHGECIYGLWVIGNDYHRSNPTWGAYPNGFLERVTTAWPELPRLHAFAGGVHDPEPKAVTLDIRPECAADITGDVLDAGWLFHGDRFAVVMADPPYDAKACRVYGTKPLLTRDVLPALAAVTEPGGHLLWFSTRPPLWSKRDWEWGGLIGVFTGTNRAMRALTILRRNGGRA